MLVSALGMTKQRTAPSLGEARKMKEAVGFGFAFFFFFFFQVKTDHLGDRGIFSRSNCTSWVGWKCFLAKSGFNFLVFVQVKAVPTTSARVLLLASKQQDRALKYPVVHMYIHKYIYPTNTGEWIYIDIDVRIYVCVYNPRTNQSVLEPS